MPGKRRSAVEGQKGRGRRKTAQSSPASLPPFHEEILFVNGWAILAHSLFLDQMERLVAAVDRERERKLNALPSDNAKLLANILDLAFEKIPADPGYPGFRHGGTLGGDLKHWFRGKTGNGRYRLFYRFHAGAKVIILAWVNDSATLRSYGKTTDAYAVFASMVRSGNPPDDWEALMAQALGDKNRTRMKALSKRPRP